ncbi:MAG: hypothetical protein Q9175_002426 [Cornicularia normoerica]
MAVDILSSQKGKSEHISFLNAGYFLSSHVKGIKLSTAYLAERASGASVTFALPNSAREGPKHINVFPTIIVILNFSTPLYLPKAIARLSQQSQVDTLSPCPNR